MDQAQERKTAKAADYELGYEHIRPENIEEEPYIWETGRGTSAAPVLYQSVQIKASGPVQDGAMSGHNNPVKLAVWESLQIDPSVPKPDIVVSLGTGTKRAPASPKHTSFRHVLLDGAAPRLWRSYMASFDGERFWNEFMNHIDKENREDYIRLNTILSWDELAIDNVDRTTELRENLRTQPESIPDLPPNSFRKVDITVMGL
ncbi:hypothetical protein MMC12_008614 [Toensbergia leucococca]|nr:hypothetical protein [Toensbergia leucococca]